MKYMVLIAKHHDGFRAVRLEGFRPHHHVQPVCKDIVKAYADACHKQGMKLGLYYSTAIGGIRIT